jgi:GTP-binding protein
MTTPEVAIVGQPNVGKSTLFNRLVRTRAAIVHDIPGVTRDRNIALARWGEREFAFIDTGGFDADVDKGVGALVRHQSRIAIAEADVVVFVFDGRAGLSPTDRDAVAVLRRSGKPVVYAVNKIDTAKQENLLYEFARLGIEPLIAISAEHDRGIAELMQEVLARLRPGTGEVKDTAAAGTRLALVGRPNVGKSSLLNRLAGCERSIVDAAPGTTRDPVDTPLTLGDRRYVLVDTAGIRRRSRVSGGLDRLTVVRSLRAIERAEIVLLVIDAVEGMTDQDARLAAYAWERGRGMAFLANKWDLVAATEMPEEAWLAAQRERYPSFAAIPALCVSAATGWNIDRLPTLFGAVEADLGAEIPTRRLNQILRSALQNQGPAVVRGRAPRFLYATQVATHPPTVLVFTSDPDRIHASYARYLRTRFAGAFRIRGAPLRLEFRRRRDTSGPGQGRRRGNRPGNRGSR